MPRTDDDKTTNPIQNARAFVARVERLAKKAIREDGDAERLRIAIREGLEARARGTREGSALEHAVHCFNLVAIHLKHGESLKREPESTLVSLAFALESLETTLAAVVAEVEAAEGEAGLRGMRRARAAGKAVRS